MIEIRNLTKVFSGAIRAVDDVSFDVARGEVLGFLGPNGAGKSTTMKMVTGFLAPTAGTVKVCDVDVSSNPIGVKRRVGYLPEGAPAYPDMTPRELLAFVAEVRGLRGAEARARIDEAIARVHLEGVLRQPIETLSKGYKRRVGLALAILHDPPVLILDEPTDGLDPNQKHEVRELIVGMAADKAIVLSTHILEEVEAVCTRAMIINEGRVVADGTPAELRARSRYHNAVRLRLESSSDGLVAELESLSGVASVEEAERGELVVFPANGSEIVGEVGRHARERGWTVAELHVEQGRLDEVFREITTSEVAATGGVA